MHVPSYMYILRVFSKHIFISRLCSLHHRITGLLQGCRGLLDPPPNVMPFNVPGIPHRTGVVVLSPHEIQMMRALLDVQSNNSPRDVLPDTSCRATKHVRSGEGAFSGMTCARMLSAQMQVLTSAPTTTSKAGTHIINAFMHIDKISCQAICLRIWHKHLARVSVTGQRCKKAHLFSRGHIPHLRRQYWMQQRGPCHPGI